MTGIVNRPAIFPVPVDRVCYVHPRPGDVIVLEIAAPIPEDAYAQIAARALELWPDHRVAILCDGITVDLREGTP